MTQDTNVIKGAVLDLIDETDPSLNKVSDEFDFNSMTPEEIEQLYFNLVETMRHNKGIGLSAIQVGIPLRVFVMETGGEYPEALFNPRIVNLGNKEVLLEEGCLSFKDMWVKIKRPDRVRVRYQLLNGETVTKEFVGLSARCVLHEYDHLEGITMKTRAQRMHWEAAMNRRKSYRRRARA